MGLFIPTLTRMSENDLRKYGCVVLVLHDPLRLLVRATLIPINPFSGMKTGVSSPRMPAIVSAKERKRSDLPLDVFYVPNNTSPFVKERGAKAPAVKPRNRESCSG